MWKNIQGSLVQTSDVSRVKFRTNISRSILEQLKNLAEKNDTHVNYLLETGLEQLLSEGTIFFNKKARPKDRIQYKTTYDKELLANVKKFAHTHCLFINDIIEYSVRFIDIDRSKSKEHKNRIEKG